MREGAGSLRRQVATNVRQCRLKRGLSQESLAHESGFHRTFIGQVERAETNVSIDSLERIAHALQRPAYELLKPASSAGPDD